MPALGGRWLFEFGVFSLPLLLCAPYSDQRYLTFKQALDAGGNVRKGEKETFDEQLRKLYFDTCNYSSEAMDLLLKVAGTDNVMKGVVEVMDSAWLL